MDILALLYCRKSLGVPQRAPTDGRKVNPFGFAICPRHAEKLVDVAHTSSSGIFTGIVKVKIPDDAQRVAGHLTGMNLKDILARIERRLKATGLSADGASRMAGKPDAIRNMRRAVKAGRGGVNTKTVEALASVLGTTAVWLLKEEGEETTADWRSEDVAHSIEKPRAKTVRVKGYVGAGDAAHFYKVADEAFEEVTAPDGATDQTVAVEIRGTSWGRFMNTWLVFYDDVRSPITEDLLGQPCVVGLSDDRILIKVIKRNGSGRYTLVSNDQSEPDMENVEIEWAAKVTSMRPR